jgi:hypothetical protein
METIKDVLIDLKKLSEKYEFISTDSLGFIQFHASNQPKPEMDNNFFMALYKDEGVGEDGLIIKGRDYEPVNVKVIGHWIGFNQHDQICCFCDVEPIGELPTWVNKDDDMDSFDGIDISCLSLTEDSVPVGNFNQQEFIR